MSDINLSIAAVAVEAIGAMATMFAFSYALPTYYTPIAGAAAGAGGAFLTDYLAFGNNSIFNPIIGAAIGYFAYPMVIAWIVANWPHQKPSM